MKNRRSNAGPLKTRSACEEVRWNSTELVNIVHVQDGSGVKDKFADKGVGKVELKLLWELW